MTSPSDTEPTGEDMVREQYKSDRNLRARIHLHARYSVNPTPWMA